MCGGDVDPSLLIFSNKARFHLSGYVNSQNTCYRTHVVHKVPLDDMKVMCDVELVEE